MKPGCFYSIIYCIFFISIAVFFTGCPRPVGECTYGKIPAEHGTVSITSIEKFNVDGKPHYRVSVDGFFKRDFIYKEAEFVKSFKSAGYGVGSKVEGVIMSGGPCPPMYYLNAYNDR